MIDLDTTGQRANEPGLTREAQKAERKARRKADWDAFWAGAWPKLKAFVAKIPVVLLVALGAAIVAAASTFDWWMSARGWNDLLPGLGLFAYIGAAASVGFWYLGVHFAIEQWQAKDRLWAWIWTGVAAGAYVICIIGVGIATVTNTANAQSEARSSRSEFARLSAERDELRDKLDVYGVDYWEASLKADERKLAAQLAIAKGTFDMPNLDIDGACGLKLSFEQRRACVQANGGVDPHTGEEVKGVRFEIDRSQAGLKRAQEDATRLVEVEEQVATFHLKKGDETALALGAFLGGDAQGNTALLIVFVVITALFLGCGGFMGHWLWTTLIPQKGDD